MPHYKRITDVLNKYGVDIVFVDCDGKIDALAPLWLEAGVNTMFPIEVGKWHADPVAFRLQVWQRHALDGRGGQTHSGRIDRRHCA